MLALDLQLILQDPLVLAELLRRGSLFWVRLQAFYQEVTLVFIKDSAVLATVNDAFGVERGHFAWHFETLAVHGQACRSQDERDDAQAPHIHRSAELRSPGSIQGCVRDLRCDSRRQSCLRVREDGMYVTVN